LEAGTYQQDQPNLIALDSVHAGCVKPLRSNNPLENNPRRGRTVFVCFFVISIEARSRLFGPCGMVDDLGIYEQKPIIQDLVYVGSKL